MGNGALAGGHSSGSWTSSPQSHHIPTRLLKAQRWGKQESDRNYQRCWWEDEEHNWSCTASSPGGETTDIEHIECCLMNSCKWDRLKRSGSLSAPKGNRGHIQQPAHVHQPQNNAGDATRTSQQAALVLYVTVSNPGHSTWTHVPSPCDTVSIRIHIRDTTSVKIKQPSFSVLPHIELFCISSALLQIMSQEIAIAPGCSDTTALEDKGRELLQEK